jgi:hypothetical protein
MRYRFRIPARATNVRYRVHGRSAPGDTSIGRITHTGNRPKPRLAVVKLRVTGWRAYEVSKVVLTYTFSARI